MQSPTRGFLIVAVDSPEEFLVVQEGHFYRYPPHGTFPKHHAQYLAIYKAKQAGNPGIEYVARILGYRKVKRRVLSKEVARYKPQHRVGNGGMLVKVMIGPLIHLHHRIVNPNGSRIAYHYTTFDKLLSAETIDEL